MQAMGMVATGQILRHRETGKDLGLCVECFDVWQEQCPDVFGTTVTVIGPLFTPRGKWTCIDCGAGQ
ncbi:hypothetical protein SEA_HOKKEND_223 [Mycobacterium phage HokkenD]|nr:hypothetical protein SEA_HOKKEND_223 [Mycobacterium phage HokkenD]